MLARLQAGLEAGERLLSGVRAAASHDAAAAASGTRAALPREAPPDDDAAAENLLAAEAMLRANPRLEAAKCSRVEARISSEPYALRPVTLGAQVPRSPKP